MTDALYLRLKSLNTRTVRGVTSPKNIVRVAAMHNLREIQAELGASAASGINPARMYLNYQLRGPATADEVAGLALALLDNAGVQTLRRDACMALELVVSLPANTAIDHRAYFAAAVAWADTHFNVPILSAAVHLDEAAPHCHILLMPLVAGRMQGGALAGGPAKIRAMLADFQQQVAQRFGITHQPRAKRLSKPNRDAAGRMALDELRAHPERLSEPAMRDPLIAALGCQAETLLALLGLTMPTTKAKAKSFVDIMTAPCKPERTRRAVPNTKHIDVAQNLGNPGEEKFDNVYLCVDVAPSPSPNPADAQLFRPAMGSTLAADGVQSEDGSRPAPGQVDVSNSARIALECAAATNETSPTKNVDLVEQREVGAGGHPSKTGYTPTAADALETQQVDQVACYADTHQCSPNEGAGIAPPTAATDYRAAGDYQRKRDDDHPAECWDEQSGEFVTAPSTPTWPPYNARASPATLAHQLLALASTTDYEPPTGQKDRHEQETA